MAELDLNYDPPWVHQAPADSNKPMSLAEAFAVRQRQQQIDSEKAMLPLRMQEMRAQISNQALDHTLKQEQVDYALKVKVNSATIWNQISQTKWDDPASVSEVYKKFAETGVVDPNAMKVVQANVQISAAAQRQVDLLQNKLDVEAMKTKPETALEDTIQNAIRAENTSRKAKNLPEMTAGEAADFGANLRNQSAILGGGKESTSVFDAQGRMMFQQTKGGGMPQGTTPGLQTVAQEDALRNRKVWDLAQDLRTSVSPSSVGAVATVNHFVFDQVLSQFDPALANDKRMGDIDKMVYAKNQIARQIAENPRYSVSEKQAAAAAGALPEPASGMKGMTESYPSVMKKLEVLQNIAKNRTYEDAKAQGVAPPYWSMPSDKEIIAMFKTKKSEILQSVKDNKLSVAKANALIMREQADAAGTLAEQYGYALPTPTP